MKPPSTIEKRFWDKVNKTSSCWLWTAAVNNQGYGVIGVGNRTQGNMLAHRFSYELYYGHIGKEFFVLHRCDNSKCVNPHHLFLGTQKDNIQDCIKKRRLAIGTKHGRAKLSEEDIKKIRADNRVQRLIALDYGISRQHVSAIKLHTFWSHI